MPSMTKTFRNVHFAPKLFHEVYAAVDKIFLEDWLDRWGFEDGEQVKVLPWGEDAPSDAELEGESETFTIERATTVTEFAHMSIQRGDVGLELDDEEDLFSEMRDGYDQARFTIRDDTFDGRVEFVDVTYETQITVRWKDRVVMKKIMGMFEDALGLYAVAPEPSPVLEVEKPRVFIGHGGPSKEWLELQNKLQNVHKLNVESFETGARAGHSIRDILNGFLASNSFAVIVFSKADELADGDFVARQNVVHEAGLFQGRLGFGRVVLLVEEGAKLFSNLDGIQHVRYSSGHIEGAVGDVIAAINREFPKTS